MRSITYNEFLDARPCWLDDENKYEIMEEIGRSKERWTVPDVMSIDHRWVSNSDKLWVILHCYLMSEEQLVKTLSIFMHYIADKTLENLSKTANDKSVAVFKKMLNVSWFNMCISDFDERLNSGQKLSDYHRNVQVTAVKESFRTCGYRLDMTADILNDNEGIFNYDSDIYADAVALYLRRLGMAMHLLGSQTSIEGMLYIIRDYFIIPYRYDTRGSLVIKDDNDIEDSKLILLRIIATVIEEEDTDNKEDVQ